MGGASDGGNNDNSQQEAEATMQVSPWQQPFCTVTLFQNNSNRKQPLPNNPSFILTHLQDTFKIIL